MIGCKMCGRRLKTQESRQLGYGPVCYRKLFGSKAKFKRMRNRNSPNQTDNVCSVIPGQMSLEDFFGPDTE
jgi:hypothetical protein